VVEASAQPEAADRDHTSRRKHGALSGRTHQAGQLDYQGTKKRPVEEKSRRVFCFACAVHGRTLLFDSYNTARYCAEGYGHGPFCFNLSNPLLFRDF